MSQKTNQKTSQALSQDEQEILKNFKAAINLSAKELESWLETEESQTVGQKDGAEESTGHESGRRIVKLLQAKPTQFDKDDFSHMKKVVSYVHRHSAQRPSGDIKDTRWRYSLMNWGHDPLK